ncbi:MAG: glutathione peroxidase [Myxococcota bacterium]
MSRQLLTRRDVTWGLLALPLIPRSVEAAVNPIAAMTLLSLGGRKIDPSLVNGRVLLFVNVASYCGYTPQYADLQKLHDGYANRGLTVIGVPCNQFGNQEPGDAASIEAFCSTRFGVTFPMLEKQDVNGAKRSPLYAYLVENGPEAGTDVRWNFEKFLVDRTGKVTGRFPSHVSPMDPRMTAAIELALAAST